MPTITIRPARESESAAIHALVLNERLNPKNLDWRRFLVALDEHGIAGAVQMRRHPDGSRELGSLVVRRDARGHAISTRLIDALLAAESAPVHLVTRRTLAARYARWGFCPVAPAAAADCIRRNYRIGSLFAALFGPLCGRLPVRMAILERPRVSGAAVLVSVPFSASAGGRAAPASLLR